MRGLLLILLACTACNPAGRAEEFRRTIPLGDSHEILRLDPEVVRAAKSGAVRLVDSFLLMHGPGATDHHQTEKLDAETWARVRIRLEAAPKEDAEIFFFGRAREVAVNDRPLASPEKLVSTGWSRVRVPAAALKTGDNFLVFRGGGQLLLAPGTPGHSMRSDDAGRTWTDQDLTTRGGRTGEYLVRLRVPQHPPRGSATTPVVDLWQAEDGVAVPSDIAALEVQAPGERPEGTSLSTWVRLGNSPTPGKGWTPWRKVNGGIHLEDKDRGLRWAQVRFDLATTRPDRTPTLAAKAALQVQGRRMISKAAPVRVRHEPPVAELEAGSTAFTYQAPSPRLEHLRKRWRLDEVIAPGKTEMEQLMLLRWWVRNQWHTGWQSHPAGWMPPWDAVIILECKDQPECLTMCTHYAAVYVQCCLALGWNARHCILDHHCVSEVYSFENDRWILMDPGNSAQRSDVGLHYERKGVPLSARELHLAFHEKKTDGIVVRFTPKDLAAKIASLCRPAPKGHVDPQRPDAVPLAELPKFPVCQMPNFRRYAFPPRNDFLTSLVPGELYQGFAEYFYDGYCWVGDRPDRPTLSPEYSRLLDPHRPADVDWKLGGTRLTLCRTDKAGSYRVDAASFMPNLQRLEKRLVREGKESWVPTPATFTWTPANGEDLVVRSVNRWGKAGRATRVGVAGK